MHEIQAAEAAMRPTFAGLRLAGRTVQALELMAYEGLSLRDAAERVGVRRDNLQRAFDLVDVRARFNLIVRHIRDNGAQEAYLRMTAMAKSAESEHVRMECNKWLAGVDGLAPVKRVEGKFSMNHSFGGFAFNDGPVDVTPED